ncbi:MAG: hypothetical protein M3169_05490 [Candidatus Eremiobacteraeota bacterium]|nr:hypothetical protein [Candidatus Eremiobacteraeota bacterium]
MTFPALDHWAPLVLVPIVMYVTIGFMLSRREIESTTALGIVAVAAAVDALVGTPLSYMIDREAMPAVVPYKYLLPLAVTVAVNTLFGAVGFWLGSIWRRLPA